VRRELKRFGQHLSRLRQPFAAHIKMDRTNYKQVELGKKNLTLETMKRIEEGLGVKLVVKYVRRRPPKKRRRRRA